jgi:ABC-2 type transport system ATP-binding protein
MMEMAEKICDDICLINRSQQILGGSLREVRRSFGRNAVALRIEGSSGVLDDRTLVTKIEKRGDELEILLAAGADAQELLRRLLAGGAQVFKFELVQPSLNDIFLEKVGGAR